MSSIEAVRKCPRCTTLRPADETNCQNLVDGSRCNWDLTAEELIDPSVPSDGPSVATHNVLQCPAGHPIDAGDLLCPTCSVAIDPIHIARITNDVNGSANNELNSCDPPLTTEIDSWQVLNRLSNGEARPEKFRVRRDSDGREGILSLHALGVELDEAVYAMLQRRVDRDYISEVLGFGRWEGRAYEVNEEINGGSLRELSEVAADLNGLRLIVREIAAALESFREIGLRHRALSLDAIRVRSRDPIDLVITDFDAARLSDLDLDVEPVTTVNVYTAPEAVMGGVTAASDWWGLGMIVLDLVTAGKCFHGLNAQVFLIHTLSDGAPIPDGLTPHVDVLLRGLLAVDRNQRWQWTQVRAWLDGESPSVPSGSSSTHDSSEGPDITLGQRSFHDVRRFTLEAARAEHWQAACALLEHGNLATWAEELKLNGKVIAALRLTAQNVNVPIDFRLGLSLKLLNPSLPFLVRETIVDPNWLLSNPEQGFELISGSTLDLLRRLSFDSEAWLRRLAARAAESRQRARELKVELDESTFRICALASSRTRLAQRWAQQRALFPDTEHSGLAALLERKQLSDEDLLILISARPDQFRPANEIIEETRQSAVQNGMDPPDEATAGRWLSLSRREIYAEIDQRIEGFARCGLAQADTWADELRLDRRLPLAQALLLLAIPKESWAPPPHQGYVSSLLGFFEKRVVGAVLRGPLVRMTIGKTTPRVDLVDLGVNREEVEALLERLLQRTDQSHTLDPKAFEENASAEWRMRSLISRAVMHRRDTGVNGLYLGFPFLHRQDRSRDIRPHLAPILLWPLKIDSEAGRSGFFSLAIDSDREVILNPAFETLLGQQAAKEWLATRDDLLSRSRLSVGDAIDAFGMLARPSQRRITRLPDYKDAVAEDAVVCSAVLFHVTFVGQSIAKDLQMLRSIPPDGSALAAMIRMGASPPAISNETLTLNEHYCLTASDPSQEQAVAMSHVAPGLLIQGPPGTGKSQTIVNLVADSIGREKSVLIVCQKLQALNVVRKRLVAEGLADRLVMVTDVNADRRDVLESVRTQLGLLSSGHSTTARRRRSDRAQIVERIRNLEEELDRRHHSLYAVDDRCGLSYRQILGRLVALDDSAKAPHIDVVRLRRLFGLKSSAEISEIETVCEALGQQWFNAHYEGSPLAATHAFPLDDATLSEFRQDFDAFIATEQTRINTIERTSPGLDTDAPEPWRQWLSDHEATLATSDDALCEALKLHYALFVTYELGDRYIELLEKIVDVEGDWSAPCVVIPGLENIVEEIGDEDIEQFAEECRSVAEAWLPSGYENSPLGVINEFSGLDSSSQFRACFQRFYDVDRERARCLAGTSTGLAVIDTAGVERWLNTYEKAFLGATTEQCLMLARLYSTFRENDSSKYLQTLDALKRSEEEICGELLNVAGLERLLGSADPTTMLEVAASCESLSDLWWSARFEGSPLNDIREIAFTPEDLSRFHGLWNAFVEAERARDETSKLPTKGPVGVQYEALQRWLGENERALRSIDQKTCQSVARWSALFQPNNGQFKADELQTQLRGLLGQVETLAASDRKPELCTFAGQLSDTTLKSLVEDTLIGSEPPASWWTLQRLRQVIARWSVLRRLPQHGLITGFDDWRRLLVVLQAETRFRQVRHEWSTIADALGHKVVDLSLPQLLNDLKLVDLDLVNARAVVSLLLSCPGKVDVIRVCQSASVQLFQGLATAIRHEYARQTAARNSSEKLDSLRPFMSDQWVEQAHTAIRVRHSLKEKLATVQDAWPTLNDYLAFRAAVMAPLARQVFSTLSACRDALGPLTSYERARAVRNSIVRHGLQAQLQQIESRFPELAIARRMLPLQTASLLDLLSNVYRLTLAATQSPEPQVTDTIVLSGDNRQIQDGFRGLRDAVARAHAKQASLGALESLAKWMSPEWTSQCATAINSERSCELFTDPIFFALPKLSAYQAFRRVAKQLRPSAFQAFALLRQCEDHFVALHPAIVDKEVRRVMLFHSYSIRKRRIEGYVPSLARMSCDSREQCELQHQLFSKIAPLASAFKACPEQKLAKEIISKANASAYRQMIAIVNGAVARAQARSESTKTLQILRERMSSNWVTTKEAAVKNGNADGVLTELWALQSALPHLRAYQAFRSRAATLPVSQLEVFAVLSGHREQLAQVPATDLGSYLRNVISREALLGWKSKLENSHPELLVSQSEIEAKTNDLENQNLELKRINRDVLTLPPSLDDVAEPGRWQDVTRFSGPRAIRLREFFTRSWKHLGLEKLRPVWLMIPEVASQLLPLDRSIFDLVIYDEASQMPIEHAAPSLYRSNLVVVSGDEKQMPPSSSFKSRIESDEEDIDEEEMLDEDAGDEERQAFEESWNRREIKDCPDLLHLAQAVLNKSTLQIHYRSEFGELIAYSNAAYYNNQLSVPIRYAESETKKSRPIEYLPVDGTYVNQTNASEAHKVVELLATLWKGPAAKTPSVGIVTFNLKQADLIEAYLEERSEQDESFKRAYLRELSREDDGEDMSIFIKNVENVQGDERDVIIFSTTFGKNAAKTFRRNFGALGKKGGERRLNVAVTRARRKIMVVTSMPIPEIADMLSQRRRAQSPRDYIQAYLEYARLVSEGEFEAARQLLNRFVAAKPPSVAPSVDDDGILQSIHACIRAMGHEASSPAGDPVLGINFSILDPNSGRLGVGVDCDPPQHPLLAKARAREVWRQEMLDNAYISIGRVSPYAWYHDRQNEVARLKKAIKSALGGKS